MTALIEAGVVAKAWLAILAMMAAQGTLLALVAYALTRADRLRPAWQAAIWLVVMFKLAVPWGPALPWSLSDLIAELAGLAGHGDAAIASGPPALQPAAALPHAWPALGWLALGLAWLAGAGFVLVRALIAQHRAARAARTAPTAPQFARDMLRALAARPPRLVIGDAATGPHVVGLVRATIVVPPALLEDPGLLRAVLLHELAHVRRRDAIARLVQIVAGAMMFWWPVARLVGRRLDFAREAACDAWALEAGDVPRPAYARLLVRMAALHTAAAPGLAAPHALDARVAAVLGPPVRARLGVPHKLALVAWIAVALGGARTAAARGDHVVCKYTPELAASLYIAHPEADLDGDGTLSRAEACELQAELRRHADQIASTLDPQAEAELETLLAEPLCCNCDRPEGLLPSAPPETASCLEGVNQ